jgi:hypothetical protein
MAPTQGIAANPFGTGKRDEVVEIPLLLPASRIEALLDLSRRRHQSVAQILRSMIDRALAAEQ